MAKSKNNQLPDLTYEQSHFAPVIGIDEVGRGCLAGPVVAAAVFVPDRILIDSVNDSKKLSKSKREYLMLLKIIPNLIFKGPISIL